MFSVLLSLFLSFFKIGFFGFGGGYAMLPMLEQELLIVHQWLTSQEFLDILAIAEMTPGPVAVNSATFVGYRLAGIPGSAVATLAVITPSLLLLMPTVILFKHFYHSPVTSKILRGLKPAALALIGVGTFLVAEKALVDLTSILWSIALFLLLLRTRIHPLSLIGLAALFGVLFYS
ncbi:MAG: chromate transporter [Firmicutes bacterium]|nr:chromate transporter [Bacillota bacterium]